MYQQNGQHDSSGHATSEERQLEEILQDPSANWADIRKAMKARGQSACTNAALMGAIAAGQVSAPEIRPRGVLHSSSMPTAKPFDAPTVNVVDTTSTVKSPEEHDVKSGESGDEIDEYLVPTYLEPLAHEQDSGKSTRKPRRMSRKGSKLISQSVNIMDFGVDNNFAELEDEVESVVSAESNYTCDSKGFLSWKHSNDDEASLQSNLSGLCDADGFLTWELTASARAKAAIAAKLAELNESMTSGSTNLSKHCDADGFLPWELSASIRAAKSLEDDKVARALSILDEHEDVNGRETWHIEDYEGSIDGECDKSDRGQTKKLSFASRRRSTLDNHASFWSHLTNFQPTSASREQPSAVQNDALELDDIKEALMKRCTVQNAAANEPKKQPSEDSKPTLLKHLNQFHSTQSMQRPSDLANSTSCTDTREAIWINQKDGGVDIEKECRKLYMLDSENREEKRSSRATKYIRRASLLG